MAVFVFGFLATISICLSLMGASEASCHGYQLNTKVKTLRSEDPDTTFTFSDDFTFLLDENCDFVTKGCIKSPHVKKSFAITYDIQRKGFGYGEENVDGCDMMREYADDEKFGCIMKMIAGGGADAEDEDLDEDGCEIPPNNLCDHKCEIGEKLQKDKMSMGEGDTNIYFKLTVDGKETELVMNLTLSKVG